MKEVVQLLTKMIFIHKRQLKLRANARKDQTKSSKVQEFLHMAPLVFMGSSSTEDPQDFIDHMYRVLRMMHTSITEALELASLDCVT